ncbi:MAG: helix-turn-helix transcriptional regulator [Eubacteriales bacterium]
MLVEKQSRELKAYRVRLGYTQKDMANKLGMSEFAYNKRENGHIDFGLSELRRLKQVLHLSDEELIRIFFTNNVA